MSRKRVLPIILSLLLAGFCLFDLSAQDSSWKTEANTRIEEIRKRDVGIHVVDGQGKSLSGARVDLQQKRKAFPFGSVINGLLLKNDQYRYVLGSSPPRIIVPRNR